MRKVTRNLQFKIRRKRPPASAQPPAPPVSARHGHRRMFPDRRGPGGLRARAPHPYCPPAGPAPSRFATPEPRTVIDFHNHLVPGVDDGAATLDEARAALRDM